MVKLCIPRVTGWRGAGLANELNGWAKAYIASQVLGARLVHPAWGLNARGYSEYFGTSRLDWLGHLAARATLPTFEMTEADFADSYEDDFRQTVKQFARRHDLLARNTYVLSVGGMWGGKGILREAYPFIRGTLLAARNSAANLGELELRLPTDALRIAIHVRRGDFLPEQGRKKLQGPLWNTALPLDWYISVCRSLSEQLTVPHRFLLFSDGPLSELEPLIRETEPVTTAHQLFNVCSDLLAMVDADLLVTSCSSFSTWAVALSKNPYIWHDDNLLGGGGVRRIWNHGAPLEDELAQVPRGVAVGHDGVVSQQLIAGLHATQRHRGWGNDLVFYGAVTEQ